ncbi:MAG TPA: HAMP domain-containing sensor histidine kinase [Acidimicrobiales bacterium]|nr:HAMP domain-containing sensor histidine kinase [Acidimicrobiales bacterium]
MRRRIVLVVVATTTLVVVAFAIPLGALIRSVARDRATAAAERDVASLSPTLSVPGVTPEMVMTAIDTTGTGADGRMAVWLADGTVVGDPEGADEPAVRLAREQGQAFSLSEGGDLELYTPVVTGTNGTAVVRALVPEALLDDGVTTAWLALAGVAVVLIAAAVVVADRLARSVTRDATELSGTARALASGQGDARAVPGPTPELADAALALNMLADRIDELRAAERERVADLSHRLRTPLTALRLDAEAAGDDALVADVERLEAAISELIRSARRPLHAGAVAATCDLAEVAQERARFWSALAEDDGRAWELDADGVRGPCVVSLSGEAAAAALDALVGNVFAHTPEGRPYALRLRCGNGWTTLDVEDAGPGIDAPDEAVGRGETGAGSTGLGLDIARRAAESAGGTLAVDRSSVGGARVRLALPLVGGHQISEGSRRHIPRHRP